jgi:hypothetical protein
MNSIGRASQPVVSGGQGSVLAGQPTWPTTLPEDGCQVSVGGSNGIFCWDPDTGDLTRTLRGNFPGQALHKEGWHIVLTTIPSTLVVGTRGSSITSRDFPGKTQVR